MNKVRADEIEPRTEIEALGLGYFVKMMQRDIDGFAALWHEDAVINIPFRPEGLGMAIPDALVGKATIVEQYAKQMKNRRDHVFWISAMHLTTDPNCVIAEASARSIVGETGGVYENAYVMVFRAKDGLLIDLNEYVNPIKVANALHMMFPSAATNGVEQASAS